MKWCVLVLVLMCGCASTSPTQAPSPKTTPSAQKLVLPLPVAKGQAEGRGEEFFDPNATGVPLFDTKGLERQPLGPYFTVGDFAHTDRTRFRYARIDAELVNCLTKIKDATHDRMFVLSAYRSYAHNERIRRAGDNAARGSFHISGSAADVVTPTPVDKFAVAVYLECGCHVGLGVSPRFYHVDVRNYPVTPWGYGQADPSRLARARAIQRRFCG